MPNAHSLHLAHARFEAARHLPNSPPAHPTRRWHGHSFGLQVACQSVHDLDAIEAGLTELSEALNYQDLNAVLGQPADDRALLSWCHQRLDGLSPVWLNLKTAPQSWARWLIGGDLECRVTQGHAFEAAHQLPNVPPGHKCGRMHGHGFGVRIECGVDPHEDPIAVRQRLDRAWAPLGKRLNWSCLNDIPGLENPTSEHLAKWLWDQLADVSGLHAIAVNETPTAGCRFDGHTMRIWKEQTLDAAIKLVNLESGDPRRQIHGHTYTVRLHLTGPVDDALGWVFDFGDVKTAFKPIFERLDHHPLYTIDGLAHADPLTLAHWIQANACASLPGLCQVDVEHTPLTGASVIQADPQDAQQ